MMMGSSLPVSDQAHQHRKFYYSYQWPSGGMESMNQSNDKNDVSIMNGTSDTKRKQEYPSPTF
jgi:hypothetical protein